MESLDTVQVGDVLTLPHGAKYNVVPVSNGNVLVVPLQAAPPPPLAPVPLLADHMGLVSLGRRFRIASGRDSDREWLIASGGRSLREW